MSRLFPQDNSAFLKPLWILAALIIVTSVPYVVQIPFAEHVEMTEGEWQQDLYRTALVDHLGEYVMYTPLKPPLYNVLHSIVVHIAIGLGVSETASLAVFGALLGIGLAPLLYVAMRLTLVPRSFAFVLSALGAVTVLPLTVVYLNYDLPVFVFMALFFLAFIRLIRHEGKRGYAFLSVSSALLVMQSTVQAAVVPFVVGCGLLFYMNRDTWSFILTRTLMAAIPAVAVLSLIVLKNAMVFGVAANSTMSGHTLMLSAMATNGWNTAAIRGHAVAAGAPEWYLWCYDNYRSPSADQTAVDFWRTTGYCFHFWDDVEPTIDRLRGMGAVEQAEALERDLSRHRNRPYLYSGTGGWFATEWFAMYSEWSRKTAAHLFRSDPFHWFLTSVYIHGNLFAQYDYDYFSNIIKIRYRDDPYFSSTFVKSFLEASKILRFSTYRTIPYIAFFLVFIGVLNALRPVTIPRARVVTVLLASLTVIVGTPFMLAFQYGFGRWIMVVPVYVGVAIFIGAMWLYLKSQSKRLRAALESVSYVPLSRYAIAVGLLVHIAITTLVYISVVGTENERFFGQLVPALIIFAGLISSELLNAVNRVTGAWRGQGVPS